MLSSFLPRPTRDFSKVTPRIWFAGFFLQDSSEESLQANLRWIHSATPTNHRCSCNFHYFLRIPFQDAWSEGFSFQGILKEILTRKKGLNPSAGQISISTRVCVNVFLDSTTFFHVAALLSFHFGPAFLFLSFQRRHRRRRRPRNHSPEDDNNNNRNNTKTQIGFATFICLCVCRSPLKNASDASDASDAPYVAVFFLLLLSLCQRRGGTRR